MQFVKPSTWAITLDILAGPTMSWSDLAKKLESKGVAPSEAKTLADKAAKLKLINDEDWALNRARSEIEKKRGALRIETTLKSHGIGDDILLKVKRELHIGEPESELIRAQKALAKKNIANNGPKMLRYLLNLGYDEQTARSCVEPNAQ